VGAREFSGKFVFGLLDTSSMDLHRRSLINIFRFRGSLVAMDKDARSVTQFIRNLRGGSQPILAQADDGLLYVVKFANNPQGPNLLFNESAGSELYQACGLPVPEWTPLWISDSFLDSNSGCWIHAEEGCLRPASGLCFGSRFLGGNGTRLLEILPRTSFKRVRNHVDFWLAWMIDICAEHADNRQVIFLEDAQGGLNAFFVDSGHLFGGPKGEPKSHFLTSRYLDSRIYQGLSSQHICDFQKIAMAIDVEQLWQRIQELPDNWKTTSAVRGFERCLGRLSTPTVLQGILEAIMDANERVNGSQPSQLRNGRRSPVPVLCSAIPAAELGNWLVGNCAGYLACAL
jgi:hypothetical protein